jgi:hypothetical protein
LFVQKVQRVQAVTKALAERNRVSATPAWMYMAPVEPRFDPLRGDRRFRELLARYGLKSEA